jgi:signal transduction histidine kinase
MPTSITLISFTFIFFPQGIFLLPPITKTATMNSFFIEKFYLFFEGIMLFQVAFFGMIYFISKRKDVLYYSLLNLVSGTYFFLNAPYTFMGTDENIVFNSPVYLYVNFALLMGMGIIYLLFLKEIFNDSLEQYKYVKTIYIITFYAIPLIYLLFVLLTFLRWNANIIFYVGHLVNGPFCTLILILNFKQQGYKKLIIYGMVIIFICVNITIALTIRYNAGSKEIILDKYPLAIIKLGMLIDILLFQLALLKRWNEQERELAIEKIQSQLEMEKVRNKISGELHDDLGSTLSGVSMYSHLTHKQMINGEFDKATAAIQIIQKSTDEMLDKLSDLVWSVKPNKESLELLFERLEQFGSQICAAKNIEFVFNIPTNIKELNIPQEHRHHLYLVMKEAVNNAVKYSEANMLIIKMALENSLLELAVIDNGKGFEIESIKSGNGLYNMKKRTEEIGARFILQTEIGKGSIISISVKYSSEV